VTGMDKLLNREDINMTGLAFRRNGGLLAYAGIVSLVPLFLLGCGRPSSVSGEKDSMHDHTPLAPTADSAANESGLAPVVEIQNEDYAQARSQFQTKLLRKGPAPQPWSPIKPPVGVKEVEYRSGDLRLRAWLNVLHDSNHKHPAVLFLHGGFAFDKDDWDLT